MTRTDQDSWDLASSVGATATMVAAARALASAENDAIINDPFAAPLVRAVGLDFFNSGRRSPLGVKYLLDRSLSPSRSAMVCHVLPHCFSLRVNRVQPPCRFLRRQADGVAG